MSLKSLHQRLTVSRDRNYPELKSPSSPPFSSQFISELTIRRFQTISGRLFNEMGFLAADNPHGGDAYKILSDFGLLPTVTEVDSFVGNIVKEFYANLAEAEMEGVDTLKVFVHGSMYEFSPSIINRMYQLPNESYPLNATPIQVHESLDDIVTLPTNGQIHAWDLCSKKEMGDTVAMLQKICCQNWIPTMNPSSMSAEQFTLLFMILKGCKFNFGKLVFDEICACNSVIANASSNVRLILPNVIDQLLRFQRIVPALFVDVTSAAPSKFKIEPKELLSSQTPLTLLSDVRHLHDFTKLMMERLAGIDYLDIVYSEGEGDPEDEEDGDETESG
ncbi:PREDICTED: uncharacterized protein LOC104728149 [Camelina sativa]|uniref:Uncharacterized protein LOC104728149 n=1 Tax=Camelina sativa TaxID=90675 RepID=A0ABM0USD5_CAMSA|nr:PREDICTED: uncharacterized protein LOC104728149 [Camelina sativa]